MAYIMIDEKDDVPQHWDRPPVMIWPQAPNPNPPPTEGLLWPRFDYIIDDEEA